ncbi:MAG: hypothetical protein M3178_08525 [Pseudomonadota bacterium]|nr:hypothetical protein [Pseudomonadota bacterium]
MWLAVFGLWVLFTFGNSMLRGLTAELDGTIESSQYASQQHSHNLFYGDILSGLGHRLAYTIRKAGGLRVTFMPGAACSLLYGHPRIGAHIHKEPWRASYELDGRLVSDLWPSYDPFCAVIAPTHLALGFALLPWGLIGVRQRPGVW